MTSDERQLDLLFSRLLWPSGMVKERTCDAVARLLIDNEIGDVAAVKLLDWTANQRIESTAAIGLLVLLRAKALYPEWQLPGFDVVTAALRKPSLLSSLLIDELFDTAAKEVNLRDYYTDSVSDDYQPDPFFVKYATRFVPLAYANRAEEITKGRGVPFYRQWAYEWQHLVTETGVRKSDRPMDFQGQQHWDHYVVFDTLMSEVYRSAFLRALAWAAEMSAISVHEACQLAMETCPVDLGLWLIDPVVRPSWWPAIAEPEGEIDTVPAQVWHQIENLWRGQLETFSDNVLIQASGRVYEKKTIYDLELFGAFQRCEGGASPSAEEVVEWYTDRPYLRYQPSGMPFEGAVDEHEPTSFAGKIEDWLLLPAARAVNPMSFPRWDFWKAWRGIWIPVPNQKLQLSCSSDGVSIRESNSDIAEWRVWTDGLREKEPGMLSSPASGEFVVARREFINGLAVELGCVFCWVCRLIGRHREYDGSEWKTFTNCRMFGTTGILRPFL